MNIIALFIFAGTANALDFSRALPCNSQIGAKTGPWCLEVVFTPGRKVSFLNHKGCSAVTGNERSVSTEEAESRGTELGEFKCPDARGLEHVLLDVVVTEYKNLEVKEIPSDKALKSLAGKIKRHAQFKELATRAPDHERLGPPVPAPRLYEVTRSAPGKRTRVVTYTQEGELPFLLEEDKLTPLVETGGLAAIEVGAIRLNGKDYLALKLCDIGGGGCGDKYIELGN